jgi:putative ABC transport system substrate-binding protein
MTAAVNAQGIQLRVLDTRSPDDVEPALAEALAWQAEAMLMANGILGTTHFWRFLDFQLQHHVPLVFAGGGGTVQVQAGGLLAYTVSDSGEGRTAATFVDKILKGAKPADLPVQQPTVYDLLINQTTALALGITVPPEVAQQVTQWVT